MQYNLKGKTALITGASSGLGERMAFVLAEHGAKVILAARREDALHAIKKQIPNSSFYLMDVADRKSVHATFNLIEEDQHRIDICINNAGIAKLTPLFEAADHEDFERMIQTNVMGTWYVTQSIATHMKQHSIAGSIINVSSVNGANKLREELTGYAVSKAAVIQMTKALVGELSKVNIRTNCIAPGLFHTPLTDYKLNTVDGKEEMAQKIPLQFVGSPADLDGTILYLASNDASRYVTGSCLVVDGGVSWGGS
ncbi:TPA: SDR family NAD(P)-dependent oxidoreductase [Legionella pneumophila]|nr:SDR family oxidoreductase [Legionella pneumophila]HAT9986971.1 SDR family oxidoreductase [Legionella pneumophila subsp. pneumophila]HBP6862255.1 SDR family oxidoreductase [Legionella pneumophila]